MGPIPEIRVAVAGVGNCVSALVQGVEYYRNVPATSGFVPGLMHPTFGNYRPGDIKFVAAFEVNSRKLNKDLSEAIFTKPNVCVKFSDVPKLSVRVMPGPILDGVASHMRDAFKPYGEDVQHVDVAEELRKAKADMLLNYCPVGSYHASRAYAQAALDAGCAFVNCIPEIIASDKEWAERFEKAGAPIAGDDIKSQLGATILHRTLVNLFLDRGVKVEETYQLNIGGDTDFLNMTEEERLATKRISKTKAVTSLLPYEVPTRIGPSDYVGFLGDKKVCYIYLRGTKFGGIPVIIDTKLLVDDSPDSAGVVIDVIRAVKIAMDRGVGGALVSISSYSFKYPPVPVPDVTAKQWVEEFIQGKREH